MTRGTLNFGGNTVKVWIDDSGEGITASTNRPLSTMKFREFAGKYESEVLPQMKPASQASVRSVIRTLTGHFGGHKLADIGGEEIQRFISANKDASKTLRNRIGVMRMMWTKTRSWGYVKHNPFEFLSMPRQPLSEARTLSVDEVRAIIRKTDEPFKTMLWILAETGIRGGELCGLYRSDVDARTIRIARSAFRKKIQTPKTANAVREIAISGRLARHLEECCGSKRERSYAAGVESTATADGRRYLALESDARTSDGNLRADRQVGEVNLLFSMPDGRPWDNGEIVRRLKPVLGTGVGLHAFRHANKSLMQSLGVPEYIQDERMGHAKSGMGGRYTHSSPEDHRRWAEAIGVILASDCVVANPISVSEQSPTRPVKVSIPRQVVVRSEQAEICTVSVQAETPATKPYDYIRHFTNAFEAWKTKTGHRSSFGQHQLSVEERAEIQSMMPADSEKVLSMSAGAD